MIGIPSANSNILLDGRIWSRSRDVEWVMLSQRYMISICFTFFLFFFSLRTDFSGSERSTQPKYCSLWLKTRECAVIVSIIRMWFPTGEVPLVLFFWNKFVGLVFSREWQWLRGEAWFFLFSSTDQTVRLRFCSDNRREIVPSIGCRDSSLPRPWGPTQ